MGCLRARHGGSEVVWLLMWHLCPLQMWLCAGLSCVVASALDPANEFMGRLRGRHDGSEVAWLLTWHLCPLWTCCVSVCCMLLPE